MSDPLALFPSRIAFIEIPNGKVALAEMAAGKSVRGYLTPEAVRALNAVLMRLGGPASDGAEPDLADILAPFTGTGADAAGALTNEIVLAPVQAAAPLTDMVMMPMDRLQELVRVLVAQELSMLPRGDTQGFMGEMVMGVGE